MIILTINVGKSFYVRSIYTKKFRGEKNVKDKFIKAQQNKLSLGAIDRRQFITSAIAAGIAIPTALSLASDAIAATPKKGGKLEWA